MRLFGWLRRRREPPPRQPSTADADLERFFTDAEDARRRFDLLISADRPAKQIVVIHGIGAVGKSSLLRMYRLSCRRHQRPVGLVGAEEAPSSVDILDRWTADLRADGVSMSAVTSSLVRYRKLLAKVEETARRAGQDQETAAAALTTAAAKGVVKVAASAIPFAGLIVDAVGGEAVEAVLNVLRASLSKPDFDFFLDPTRRLTDDFLADLGSAADRRPVLMLDTYEQATALGDWLRDLVQRLPEPTLVVIAGRVIPEWDRAWQGWIGRAEIIELTEMSDADVQRLVQQYYALFGRGEPDADHVQTVVRFARGLPLAATTAVRLWVNHQLTDLQPLGQSAVAELADRLLEGVPAELRPAFEAAAVLRFFNADSLAALLGTDGKAEYDELRRWPFTRPRREGLAVHDTMREVMNDALRARSPHQFRAYNEAAAAHYAALLAEASSDERDRLRLEWLYHSIRADERAGLRNLQELADELVRYQVVGRLRALVNDASSYPLQEENSRLWRRYYAARLDHLQGMTARAEAEYRAIGDSEDAEPRLRAYALCDLGTILVSLERLAAPDGERRAVDVIERSLSAWPLDAKLVANHESLMNVSNARADWQESLEHLRPMREHAESTGDSFALIMTDRHEAAIHALRGDWRGYLTARRHYEAAVAGLGDVPALRMHVAYFTWPLVYMGRYREAQISSEEALTLAVRLEEKELMVTVLESVGLALGMQEAYPQAAERFGEAWNFYENFHVPAATGETGAADRYVRAMLSFRGLVALRAGRLDQADADLQRALDIKRRIRDRIGLPEVHAWRGQLHEQRDEPAAAEAEYREVLGLGDVGRVYFEATARAGLARLHAARHRDQECADQLAAAERSAQRYEYNDLLAALRLSQAQLAWEGRLGTEAGFDAAAARYRQALVHALRYNRFALDEVLGGRPEGTPLPAVIPSCLERGDEGNRMLHLLHEWWRSGTNDVEPPREESITPLPVGAPLLEAERLARTREPGSGGPQRTVLEQLGAALESPQS